MRSLEEFTKARFRGALLRSGFAALAASVALCVIPWMQMIPLDGFRGGGPGRSDPWPTESALMARFGSLSVGLFVSVIALSLVSLWSMQVSVVREAFAAFASGAASLLLVFEAFWADLPEGNGIVGFRFLGTRHLTLAIVVVAGALGANAFLLARAFRAIVRKSQSPTNRLAPGGAPTNAAP